MFDTDDWRLHVDRDYSRNQLSFYLIGKNKYRNLRYLALPATIRTIEENGNILPAEPFFHVRLGDERAMLTELMDELWGMGIRPSIKTPDSGIDFVKDHLQDMRTLAFELLDMKAPEIKKK